MTDSSRDREAGMNQRELLAWMLGILSIRIAVDHHGVVLHAFSPMVLDNMMEVIGKSLGVTINHAGSEPRPVGGASS